ncbi:MAG: LysM peptidoglycan-binding domain-containing protein [Lachnospiraceae bacterium]|nr:LysM peptidoglycan-binding domain-containing protein [Lachnospiraceae bacterium]
MELPKNVTQIGEVDRHCKVYVEDYVVSYIKQLNTQAETREISVALYGRYEQENGLDYHFIYGACKVEQLPKEVRHLSQAQLQEVEKYRRKYFPELTFAGYRLLNGEMIEGFYIYDRDICRYIAGYAQFYEKNDAMLAYMLEVREDIQPEHVDQEKYERVRQRREERRIEAAEEKDSGQSISEKVAQLSTTQNLQRMRLAAVAVFALLCLFGVATFRDHTADPADTGHILAVNATDAVARQESQKDKLVIEDKLEDALREENQKSTEASAAPGRSEEGGQPESTEAAENTGNAENVENTADAENAESAESAESAAIAGNAEIAESAADTGNAESAEKAENSGNAEKADKDPAENVDGSQQTELSQSREAAAEAVVPEAVAYIIQPGDTLIAISKRQYGTDSRVQDICDRNKITDPNNIKQGQVIMLPR